MTNLIIGLCFGIAAAVALAAMWRIAKRAREIVEIQDDRKSKSDVGLWIGASETSANDS